MLGYGSGVTILPRAIVPLNIYHVRLAEKGELCQIF